MAEGLTVGVEGTLQYYYQLDELPEEYEVDAETVFDAGAVDRMGTDTFLIFFTPVGGVEGVYSMKRLGA
jgi:hypothetical protein